MKDNSSQAKSQSEIARLKKLVELMKEYDLVELHLDAEGSVALRRREEKGNGGSVWLPNMPMPQNASGGGPAAAPTPVAESGPAAGEAPAAASREGLVELKSPIVGTFYRSPAPDKEAFVDKGARVRPDTVVCIIEAMKVMNEIRAEMSGEIVEVLARNGDAVEFNQPLFLIRP